MVAAVLGYKEFLGASTKLIRDGLVPEEWLTLAEFPDLMATGDSIGKDGLLRRRSRAVRRRDRLARRLAVAGR